MNENLILQEITQDDLANFKSKKYYSGREIKVGDKLGWGLFNYNQSIDFGIPVAVTLTISSFNIDEIDSIYKIERMAGKLPVLSIIGK